MELSKQEMELFLLFPDLRLKNFFYKMFPTFNNEFKTSFGPNFFSTPKMFRPKLLLVQIFFNPQNFSTQRKNFDPKIFLNPKSFLTQKFSWPKIFLRKTFFKSKFFLPNFFSNKKISSFTNLFDQNIWTTSLSTKIV